jgi:ubiquinone/menaquinone biosynthesis C-methylase UbiE
VSYDKRQATEEFVVWSRSYDRSILQYLLFGPSHRAIMSRVSAMAGDRPLKLLDVGCGTGVFADRLRAAFPNFEIYGIDLVADMLKMGECRWRSNRDHVMPVQADSERLPFRDHSFDIVTCANSFHHYPRQERAVAEMSRVLRPGGRLMLVDGYRDNIWGWLIYDVCVATVEGAVHHASAKRIRDLAGSAGLGAVTQRVQRGLAPFLLTEATAKEQVTRVPVPHFRARPAGTVNAATGMDLERDGDLA